jgi:hypothetical protein
MAKVLSDAGRYVSQQTAKKFQQLVVIGLVGFGLMSFLFGVFAIYGLFLKHSSAEFCFSTVVFVLLMLLVFRVLNQHMDTYEKERLNFLKGATGEETVARKTDHLPDDFHVIHDLPTRYGNLDHVIIGPTGVFILETKNWRGTIKADGNDDILLNDAPTRKPTVNPLVARIMDVRKNIETLPAAERDLPYFHALLVFTSAWVEARWGRTGAARCITDDQIWRCIVEEKPERKLTSKEIDWLSQAFITVAATDKEYTNGERPKGEEGFKRSTHAQGA